MMSSDVRAAEDGLPVVRSAQGPDGVAAPAAGVGRPAGVPSDPGPPPAPGRPPELDRLLGATDPAACDRAWEAFVQRYTPILLSALKGTGRDRDAVMDAYAFVLETLRADDGRRLRVFRPDGPGSFTTWLTVVGRRLAVDFRRHRLGRPRSDETAETYAARRRLADLVGADVRLEELPAPAPPDGPAVEVGARDRALECALATLDPRDRLLVRLRFEDEAPVREIARLMAFPTVFHVYRRLDRVLARLRKALQRAGIHHASD